MSAHTAPHVSRVDPHILCKFEIEFGICKSTALSAVQYWPVAVVLLRLYSITAVLFSKMKSVAVTAVNAPEPVCRYRRVSTRWTVRHTRKRKKIDI